MKKVEKKKVKRFRLKKKYVILTIVLAGVAVFALVLATSYAFFTTRVTTKEYVIYTGNLQVEFDNNGSGINLQGTKPMTNQEGLATTGYTFNVKNKGTINARYQVRLELTDDNEIPIEYIKMAYTKTKDDDQNIETPTVSEPVLLSNLNDSLTFITNEKIEASKTDTINLKVWLDLSTQNDMQGKTFKAKIIVDAIQDVDDGYVMETKPIITLNKDSKGNIDQILTTGEVYQELGVEKVTDDKDILSVEDVTITGTVDTNTVGTYTITYTVTDSDSNTTQITRTVYVGDEESLNIKHSISDVLAMYTEAEQSENEAITCSHIYGNDDMYLDCQIKDTLDNAIDAKARSVIIVTKDLTRTIAVNISTNKNIILELNGYNISSSNTTINTSSNSSVIINNDKSSGGLSSSANQVINVSGNAQLTVNNTNINRTGTGNAAIWIASSCNGCTLTLNNSNITSTIGLLTYNSSAQSANVIINGGSYVSTSGIGLKIDGNAQNKNNTIINSVYIKNDNDNAIYLKEGNLTINGEEVVFDSNDNYVSGTYIYGNNSNGATIQQYGGKLVINGGTIYHGSAENGTWRQHALRMDGGTAYLNDGKFKSLGTETVPTGGVEHTVYLNVGNSKVYLNGATIDGTLRINYNASSENPDTTAYLCSGSLNDISVLDGAHAYIKSSGITWGTAPTFGTYIIKDDTITCTE